MRSRKTLAVLVGTQMLASALTLSGCHLPWRPDEGAKLDWPAETIEGEAASLGESGRIRVIDVWATWCRPCREALPRVEVVLARHPEVQGVLLSIDDDAEVAQRYANTMALSGLLLHFRGGGRAASQHGINTIPLVVVLGTNGEVVSAFSSVSEDDLEQALHQAGVH
jgi:thiol-disulfide isomerase/thioredoxin